MNLYEFTVHLDRSPTDDEVDALYEPGLDDCSPVSRPGGPGLLMVSRQADTLTQAILSVVAAADLLLRARLLTPDMGGLEALVGAGRD